MRGAGSTRIEVTTYRSDLGWWRAARRDAEPRLRNYVHGYFSSEGFLPRRLRERHLPAREVAIVLNSAAPHHIVQCSETSDTIKLRNAWVIALQHRHRIYEAVGARDFMVIRLLPMGAQMLLRTPMDLLTDRALPLEAIDPQFSRLLMERVWNTQDRAARFDIVENILASRLASAPPPPSGLQRVWGMLQEYPSAIDLARLPEEFGCSRRHLIAQFHLYFGMAPKTVVRIGRFHAAVAAIHCQARRDPPYAEGRPYLDCATGGADRRIARTAIGWTHLALGCGYYDQSHFINEFRSFSGMSPLEFLQRTRNA